MSTEKVVSVDSTMVLVESSRTKFEAFLKPLALDFDRFAAQVKLALRKEPKLLNCTQVSIIDSLAQAAELGLDPSGRLGSAYLVPFGNECALIPGYRGLIDLAVRSGQVVGIRAMLVHWKDRFEWHEGLNQRIIHDPFLPDSPPPLPTGKPNEDRDALAKYDAECDPGPLRAAYAVARLSDGSEQARLMTRRDLMIIKARSKSARNPKSAWNTDEEAMHLKSPVRALCKHLALNPKHASLIGLAMELDSRERELDLDPDPGEEKPRRGADKLRERLKPEVVEGAVVKPKPPAVIDVAEGETEEEARHRATEPPPDVELPKGAA